jgi:hypothetical protein
METNPGRRKLPRTISFFDRIVSRRNEFKRFPAGREALKTSSLDEL